MFLNPLSRDLAILFFKKCVTSRIISFQGDDRIEVNSPQMSLTENVARIVTVRQLFCLRQQLRNDAVTCHERDTSH